MAKLARVKEGIDIENPRPFKRMSYALCAREYCTARAIFRLGNLDACGKHPSWAIQVQLKEGEVWKAELRGSGVHLARYVT
jgi:hypothetical protein